VIVDCIVFNDELDMLECRLTEIGDVVDYVVAVEADVDHQDNPKPYHLTENLERFERWADKLVVVQATDLPTLDEASDPWAREHAQREWIHNGLIQIGAPDDAIVLQSDVDEIPRALHVVNVRPGRGLVAFGQRGHFWAVDWFYPHPWKGTVAGTFGSILDGLGPSPFAAMRDLRNTVPTPPGYLDAGWHLSWLGGPDRALKTVSSFCHPEVRDQILAGIDDELSFWRDGVHVDGVKLEPVDVDEGWPRWIVEGYAPSSWYRPR